MISKLTAFAAFSGMTAVMLGAFAAHGLKGRLSTEMLAVFQTGVHYQLIHAVVLLYVAQMLRSQSGSGIWLFAGGFFVAGTLLFSGSLYGLALGGPRWLGPITPIGGLCFILGWLSLLIAAFKQTH